MPCYHPVTPFPDHFAAPTPAPPPAPKPQPPTTPLLRKQIFKPQTSTPVKSVVDSLASNGDIPRAVDEAVSEVPELFRSVSAAVTKPVERAIAPVVPAVPEVKGLSVVVKAKIVEIVKGNTPPAVLNFFGGVHSWWTKDRLKSVVEGTVLRRETDALIVQGPHGLLECTGFHNRPCSSVITPRLRFVERRQVWGCPARSTQDPRGIPIILGGPGGLPCGNCQGMSKS